MKRLLSLLVLASSAAVLAGEVRITLPPETATFKPAAGVETVQANCLICHSADYLRVQPPMPRKFWEGEVKKMREKYGAPIADESVPKLVEYLAANYGAPEK